MLNLDVKDESGNVVHWVDHVGGCHQLANSVQDIAALVFYVEFQQNVRIGPQPRRHGALQRDRFGFVYGVAVMRKQGKGSDEQEKGNDQTPSLQLGVHAVLSSSNPAWPRIRG